MDFPRAWEIARAEPIEAHDPRCSYARTTGALLCDCRVLTKHEEYLAAYVPDADVTYGAPVKLRETRDPWPEDGVR